MQLIVALSAFLGIASIAAAIPTTAEGGTIAALDATLHQRDIFDVRERSVEASVDIPFGIHVIPADSTTPSFAAAAYNNPFHIAVNVGQQAVLRVTAYAALPQVVTFSGVPGASGNVVFTGSGEGVPMTQNGQQTYAIPQQADGYLLTALFQYSRYPGGPPQSSFINGAPTLTTTAMGTTIVVKSEDSIDNDDKDSYAVITIQ